jgi:hypothetical protein
MATHVSKVNDLNLKKENFDNIYIYIISTSFTLQTERIITCNMQRVRQLWNERKYICVCVYVCMYLCMYVYMYVCVYVCMYVCMYVMCVCVCVYVCMYVCMYVFISVRVCRQNTLLLLGPS